MDAFYASVEQMDNPELKGKPIAVGGNSERGVVAAASYEARTFGVRSAMPSSLAKKKCPDLIFIHPRFDRYKELSLQIRDIFFEYTDLVEPLSLDEAFLDVTENKMGISSASKIAREIREKIAERVGLTASAGISINKFTAKIATEVNKPNGQKTILPEDVIPFLEDLEVHRFFGVGKVTAEKMNRLGIFKGKDLKKQSLEALTRNFGKMGPHFYNIVRGIQHSEVTPDRVRKSVGAEHTYSENLRTSEEMLAKLEIIAEEVERRLVKNKIKGRTITLKIKYSDFSQQTRSRSLDHYVQRKSEIFPIITGLLNQDKLLLAVRLLGISLSNLDVQEADKIFYKQLRFNHPSFGSDH
ncbi:DNA polymerase IV [bacterium SCSIO 12741]|nr:DNA polymerase IV [bacterium SCSIO 12741]